jgi:hypothetical protein
MGGQADPLDRYNVVWTGPSRDSSGSMPLGNGNLSLNLWMEQNGDLLFYVGATGAWSENAQLLKLGKVRVRLTPSPFRTGEPFRQALRLRQGEVEVKTGPATAETSFRIWVDANHPVIHVEIEGTHKSSVLAALEPWRTREWTMDQDEVIAAYGMHGAPDPVVSYPDVVRPEQHTRIVWYHRNEHSIWPLTMRLQGLEGLMGKLADPLLNRTFGGAIEGTGLVNDGPTVLRSRRAAPRHVISIYVLTRQTATTEEWVHTLEETIAKVRGTPLESRRKAHLQWWNAFWERSWIRITGDPDAETVSKGYALQRYVNACAGRGDCPIKFNGSIFTVDGRRGKMAYTADYRAWGGPYWFQNTRLIYWPMIAAGDFDLMEPFFRMYVSTLALARARTPIYFGHEGAFFPETMYFWGAYANENYGWDRRGKTVSYVQNTYIRYYWQGGLELIAMMLDNFAVTRDAGFLQSTLLPLADAILQFYDRHYPRDGNGKVLFQPAAALETWQEAVNPLPEIAGLQFDLDRLLALPPGAISQERRTNWQRLREQLPPVPTRAEDGGTVLLAAGRILTPARNVENPELYAIFPYRLYGVSKPDLATGRLTFEKRRVKGTGCWRQDAIQAALLGFTNAARSYTVENFSSRNPAMRFPAFWMGTPQFSPDWMPDEDHGGVSMMALQQMLLQADSDKMLLFPAWPRSWDVEFKLHAPRKTVVEGEYRNGRLQRLRVMPEERKRDLVDMAAP